MVKLNSVHWVKPIFPAQRVGVCTPAEDPDWFPAIILGLSQLPETPTPRDPVSSLGILGHMYVRAQTTHKHTHLHIIENKNRIVKSEYYFLQMWYLCKMKHTWAKNLH